MNPEETATTIHIGHVSPNAAIADALDWCADHAASVLFHRQSKNVWVKASRGSTETSHTAATFVEAVAVCRKALAASEG